MNSLRNPKLPKGVGVLKGFRIADRSLKKSRPLNSE